MKFPLFGHPKWKHPDPQIRAEAVAQAEDEDLLVEIAQGDDVPAIRAAALARISSEELLTWVAIGSSDMSLPALDRISDELQLAQVARTAALAEARRRAVARLDDTVTLQRIAAQDTDAGVRTLARQKLAGRDGLRQFLKHILSHLEVDGPGNARGPSERRNLEGVCEALAADPRFRIHGMIGDVEKPAARGGVVELLGNKNAEGDVAEETFRLLSYFHIEVRRTGLDAFDLNVSERALRRTP